MNEIDQKRAQVRLKGVGKNLCVMVDPTAEPDLLEHQIGQLLDGVKDQVFDAHVTLDVGTEEEQEELIDRLGGFMMSHYGVRSVARIKSRPRVPSMAVSEEERLRQRDLAEGWHNRGSDTLMMAGRVRSGQKVTAERHVVILGDVNPGAEVLAGGDIIIMGSLLGTAIAGQPDDQQSIILALDFRPTQIQIGKYVAAGAPGSPGRIIEFAHVEDDRIVVDNYIDANPFAKLRWPQVR